MTSKKDAPTDNSSDPTKSDAETGGQEISGERKMVETVNFSPNKGDIYRAVKADVDVDEAVLELVDNIIDNWERVSRKTDSLLVEFFLRSLSEGGEELVIRDNSGGVLKDELNMLFGLGMSAKGDVSGSVGSYGVGMKKAILRLADEATIVTRYKGAEKAYGFSVNKEWLDEDGWERPIEEFDDVPEGVTEIRLRRLNFTPTGKFDDIEGSLASTYEIFLGGGPGPDVGDYDFEIRVEGEALERPEPVNWSYPPFDGLHPRQYRDIELDSRDVSDPVKLHVTVGLLQTASFEHSGTDVYLQRRKVHDSVKDEQGGFGLNRQLGEYKESQHKRLKIIVEMETTGDSRDLPWNSSKNGLDLDSQIAEQAFNWVARIAQQYYKATYQAVPATFLRPYGRDSPYAAPPALGDDAYNFSNQANVTKPYKPTAGFPEVNEVRELAEAHARLGIRCTDGLKDEHIPAYDEHLKFTHEKKYDGLYEDLVDLQTTPGLVVGDIDETIRRLDKWAVADAHERRRFTNLEEWETPRYEAKLEERLPEEMTLGDAEEFDERPSDEPDEPKLTDDLDVFDPDDVESTDEDDLGDREEFIIACTPEHLELFDSILPLETSFAEATSSDRADALVDRLERLAAVLRVAGRDDLARADD